MVASRVLEGGRSIGGDDCYSGLFERLVEQEPLKTAVLALFHVALVSLFICTKPQAELPNHIPR